MSNVKSAAHGTLRCPAAESKDFANELSELVINGWEIMSTGFDGISQSWWAVYRKVS